MLKVYTCRKYLISELVAGPERSGGKVSHVLEYRSRDEDRLLGQLLLVSVQERLKERETERVSGVAPQPLSLSLGGGGAQQRPLPPGHSAAGLVHLPETV